MSFFINTIFCGSTLSILFTLLIGLYSYLYISRAMDYFDLSKQFKNGLVEAFQNHKTRFLIISFSSDWLYPTKNSKDIVIALNASGANVAFAEIKN